MKKMFEEFKAFILRGNVLDMAVGVIIGGAFGKITTSLVNDVIMPLVGLCMGKVNFSDLKIVFEAAKVVDDVEIAEVALYYGNFIQTVVDFLIVAASVFVMVKAFNKLTSLKKKEEEAPAPEEPKGPTTEELLAEVVEILKNK